MQKITPHLWYDREASEAAGLYTSLFPDSKVRSRVTIHDTPSGSVEIVTAELSGQEFILMSAGPMFRFTPAISFLVACDSAREVDAVWAKLGDGGTPLMEIGSYPWSERYGWVQDRYGLSWQLMMTGKMRQKITPVLMYTGDQAGRAEEAIRFYTSVFPGSQAGTFNRYGANEGPDREGTLKHATFTLAGEGFAAMDSAHAHGFGFNEAISLLVNCTSQQEIDRYWEALSADPKAEQCGWLKDRFGVSWQIAPASMSRMLEEGTPEQRARLTGAFLQMKKFDLRTLEEAYAGRPSVERT